MYVYQEYKTKLLYLILENNHKVMHGSLYQTVLEIVLCSINFPFMNVNFPNYLQILKNSAIHIDITISTLMSVRPSLNVRYFPSLNPAVVSQNVTNKSCLVCDKSEKYAFWMTVTPQLDHCCRGEAKVRIINFKTTWSEFQMPSPTAPAEAKPRCVYSILLI